METNLWKMSACVCGPAPGLRFINKKLIELVRATGMITRRSRMILASKAEEEEANSLDGCVQDVYGWRRPGAQQRIELLNRCLSFAPAISSLLFFISLSIYLSHPPLFGWMPPPLLPFRTLLSKWWLLLSFYFWILSSSWSRQVVVVSVLLSRWWQQ